MFSIERHTLRGLLAGLAIAITAPGVTRAQEPGERLAEARRLYDDTNYEDAMTILDAAVSDLEPRLGREPAARATLSGAYELRVRAEFGLGNERAAEEDLGRLFRLDPNYRLPPDVSPKLLTLFETVRRNSIGDVLLTVIPENAEVDIDGDAAVTGGRLSLIAGVHVIAARRPGFKSVAQNLSVVAGESHELSIELERSAATLTVFTSPSGVEVVINGVSRGTTTRGDSRTASREIADRLNVEISTVSAPFVVPDLNLGSYTLEYRRPCFSIEQQRFNIAQLVDYSAKPVKLMPAVASIQIETTSGGATAYVDETPRGAVPATLSEICEGPHTVEVRSSYGRYVSRLEVRAGEKRIVNAVLKPAFAILSRSGADDALRGVQDIRLAVEQKLADAAGVTVFSPSADRADAAMRSAGLSNGWLAFDRELRPLGDAARITPAARRQLSAQLARLVDAQGVAAITTESAPGAPPEILLSLLAAGSSEPDVHTLRLDDPESARRLLDALAVDVPVHRPAVGMLTIDVQGLPGAVVATTDPDGPAANAGIVPGDAVTTANGKPVPDTSEFVRILTSLKADERLNLGLKGRNGGEKTADVTVGMLPRALSTTNQTLPFNQMLLMLRHRLAAGATETDEPVLRLNIGIALIRLGNYEDARSELEKVQLADGGGVSSGTVQYLLGLCYEKLGQLDRAARAWTASAASEALLTEEGPPVRVLAAEKLVKLPQR